MTLHTMKAGGRLRGLFGSKACALLLVLGACAGPSPEQLLARAAASIAEGDYRAAVIDLRTAVADDPTDPVARYRLGIAALAIDDAGTAAKELVRARELGYEDPSAIVEPLCEAYLKLGKATELVTEVNRVDEPSAALLALAGDAFLQLGEQDRALRAYQRAYAQDDGDERALLGLARFARSRGDTETARKRLAAAVALHPESPDARLAYGRFLFLQTEAAAAQSQFEAGLALPETERRVQSRWDLLLALAETQLARSDVEGATATIERLDAIRRDHPAVVYLRARIAFDARDLVAANELVGRALVNAPDFTPAQMLQGAIHLARGDYGQARMFLQTVVNKNPTDPQARKLLAAAELGLEEEDAGAASAGGPVPLGQEEVLALMGLASAETGDYTSALGMFERAHREDPENRDMTLDLLTGYLLAGRTEEGRALLAEAQWETDEQRRRAATLDTLLSLRENDIQAARTKAAEVAADYPDEPSATSLRGLVEVAAGDEELARRYLEATLEAHPSHTTSVVNLARIDLRAGDESAARARLERFVERNPGDALALTFYAELVQRGGDLETARRLLQRVRSVDPDAVAARQRLAQLYVTAGEYEQAEIVAREVVELRPQSSAAHNTLGVVLTSLGRTEDSLEYFRQAVRLAPEDVEPLRNLARAEVITGQYARAGETTEQLLRAAPDDAVGLELAARLALSQRRTDEAEALISRLERVAPDIAAVDVLRGDLAGMRNDLDTAIARYESAYAAAPTSGLVARLYTARVSRGDPGPEAVLNDWLGKYPDDAAIRMVRAQHAHSAGDSSVAIGDYERVVELDSNNAIAHNNLAWLYEERGDGRALPTAQRAFDLAPDSPQIQDTYGWLLVEGGQLDNGVAILREAWEQAPEIGDIGYHLAEGLARRGERDEAREVLEKTLENDDDFPSRLDAERLLGEL
jgi:putative PEP-CTERM system TPR-repeat lipoprotein